MENLTAFSLFAIVASITPGPTNFIILSLSSHYKISKTLPVILGSLIYAELSGDFPLGDSRQPIYKSLRP
ncbi:hypothetical protein ABTD75_16645, partial [Acinetobacter baumannii]